MRKFRDFHSQTWDNPFSKREGSPILSRIFGFLAIIVISAVILYGFIYSPLLRIRKIEILGAKSLDQAKIKAVVGQGLAGFEYLIWPKDYFFTANAAGIRNQLLMQFSILRDASIEKKYGKLVVTIEEKEPSYRLMIGDRSYLLDQDGIGLKEASVGEGDALIALMQDKTIYAPDKPLVAPSLLQSSSELHKYFATQVGVRDRVFVLNPSDETITVISTEGWGAVLDSSQDIRTQLDSLSSALLGKFSPAERQKLSYIDVRFGDKVYYKWK